MSDLYTYSLVPVGSVALLLAFETLVRSRRSRALALYCLSIALWTGILFISQMPQFAHVQVRMAAFGTLVAATHVHAMYELMGWQIRGMVWLAYATSISLTLASALMPALLHEGLSIQEGPWSLSAMALAGLLSLLPLEALVRSGYAKPEQRPDLSILIAAGLLCFVGGWGTLLLLSVQKPMPYGMLLVLLALLLVGHLLNRQKSAQDKRLLERSFIYTTLAALLSAGFLFAVLWLLSRHFRPASNEYYISVLFMFFMAALAFEPVRQFMLDRLGGTLLRHRTSLRAIAQEFAAQEQRVEHAERLAELGTFASAVAHEVRNPLGVLTAHLRLLQRQGADPELLEMMQEQIHRANHFVDDLLAYSRPRPLELRRFLLQDLVELAISTAKAGLGSSARGLQSRLLFDEELQLEADQSQMMQVFVILTENAILALSQTAQPEITVEARRQGSQLQLRFSDNGPGVPEAARDKLFAPFFTTRKREAGHLSTGLGLAIAKGIIERHHGSIQLLDEAEGTGAIFALELPLNQPLLAATQTQP